jgi:hypothetical protein
MLIAAALAATTVTLTDRTSVTLVTQEVRVSDVAGNAGPIARTIIAHLPRGRREIALSRRAIAALIRRAVPGVMVAGADRDGTIALRAPMLAPRAKPIPLRLPDPPAVRAGDELTLLSRAGPVTIERPVIALQPGYSGRRLFVRDRAGHVSSIHFVGETAP